MHNKVSIIIPMYNEQRYIARCLDSLKQQTYKDFELILIDDGSKDNTVEIAKQYHKDFNLIILQQKNSGPGKARNRGAKEAKGDILIFVDADMFFDKDYLKHLIQPILEGKEVGTSHGTELVGNLENRIARAYGIIRGKYDSNIPRSNIYRAIKKEIFLESGGFDISKGYFDDDLSKVNNGLGALFIEKAICYHNNPESFKECLKHSSWVGKGLIQSGAIKNYLIKYIYRISIFCILSIGISYYLYVLNLLYLLPLTIIAIVLILIFIKTIERTIKERYISHIIYIPLVMLSRGIGYLLGIFKHILNIK